MNPAAFYDDPGIGRCIPFFFKADELSFEKDSSILFFKKKLAVKKLILKTSFEFNELRGVAAISMGTSKNKFSFPVFVSQEVDKEVHDSIIQHLVEQRKEEGYDFLKEIQVLIKDNSKIFEFRRDEALIYIMGKHALFIPRPLPIGQFSPPGCGVAGDGETFIYDGLAFVHEDQVLFLPEDKYDYMLSTADILKLFSSVKTE